MSPYVQGVVVIQDTYLGLFSGRLPGVRDFLYKITSWRGQVPLLFIKDSVQLYLTLNPGGGHDTAFLQGCPVNVLGEGKRQVELDK